MQGLPPLDILLAGWEHTQQSRDPGWELENRCSLARRPNYEARNSASNFGDVVVKLRFFRPRDA